jgi:hydroxyquinol 1,2-dioxygenase
MRNFDEKNITDAVIDRLANSPSPRAKQISASLVRHLHDFVREIEPSQPEWEQAIDFLTRTGQMCCSTRQEFILLSDALGVSTLVDAIKPSTSKYGNRNHGDGPVLRAACARGAPWLTHRRAG